MLYFSGSSDEWIFELQPVHPFRRLHPDRHLLWPASLRPRGARRVPLLHGRKISRPVDDRARSRTVQRGASQQGRQPGAITRLLVCFLMYFLERELTTTLKSIYNSREWALQDHFNVTPHNHTFPVREVQHRFAESNSISPWLPKIQSKLPEYWKVCSLLTACLWVSSCFPFTLS